MLGLVVLTSLTYQNGYRACGGSQRYHYGRYAVHKYLFVALKLGLRRNQKKGKTERKIKNCVLQKKTILFLCVYELDIVLGVNTEPKNSVGKLYWPKFRPMHS